MDVYVLLSVVRILVTLSPGLSVLALNTNDDIDNLKNSLVQLQQTVSQQAVEFAATKTALKSATDQLQSTKDELFAVKTELQSTSAQLISVKSDLKSIEAECFNETKSDGSNTTPHLSGVLTDVNSMKTALDVLYRDQHANMAEIQALKDQLSNLTNLKSLSNIGFLMSSKAGDNGIFHAPVVYDIHENSTLMFSQTTLDKGNAFTVKNGTMTAPVTGIYLLWVNINMEKIGLGVRLFKSPNGETVGEKYSQSGQLAFSTPVYLNAGETVAVQILGENLLFPQTPVSEFGGVLIKAF